MITRHTLKDPKVWAALAALPALGTTGDQQGDLAAVKLFDAWGASFWVLWEYDADDKIGYGLCDLGMGSAEIGSVSVAELDDQFPGSLRIPIERDMAITTRYAGYKSRNIDVPDYL